MSKTIVTVTLLTLQSFGPSQSTQQPATPQFRASSDLVVVDVSVLDRGRRPIRGLSIDDFTVLDEGIRQTITTFQSIDVPEVDVPSAKWTNRVTLDVQSNDIPDGRLVLLYMDERSRSSDPFFTRTARDLGHAVIDRLGANDVAAVAFVVDHRVTQEFTTDRGRLHAAIDNFRSAPAVDVSVVRSLRDLASHLGAIPERRKLIIYVGSGEPFDTEVMSKMDFISIKGMAAGQAPRGSDNVAQSAGAQDDMPFRFGNFQQRDTFDGLLDLFRTAQRSNVTIYTLDPIGLSVQKVDSRTGAPIGCTVSYSDKQVSCAVLTDFLRMLAANTGGRAVVGNNAPIGEVPAIFRENSSYYLIGFRPADLRASGRFRRIDVKVNRPNVVVRARRGYVEPQPASTAVAQAAVPAPVETLLPSSSVRLKVVALPLGPDAASSTNVAMAITAEVPETNEPSEGAQRIVVSYSVLDMGGRERAKDQREFAINPESRPRPSSVDMLALEHLTPGRYDIRVSARVIDSGRRGELFADIAIPDFKKDTLAVSGVIVQQVPPPNALPGDALFGVMTGIPTTGRVFTSSSAVSATLRLYHGATAIIDAVTLKTVILDSRDRVAFQATDRLEGTGFRQGFVEHRFDLPLRQLVPGTYLLRFEASRSSSPVVRREVRFEVK
jgi:VWFA-related protein